MISWEERQAVGQIAQAPSSAKPIDFEHLQTTIDALLPKIRPAVVCIECGGGSGSGVIVSADGLVLTAAHVIDKSQELTIIYPDGRRFKGKSLGTYGPSDAGMGQILEGAPHPFVNVASGLDLKVDDTVMALGHPGGFDPQRGTPLRIGHILSLSDDFFEADVALIGGDSGGPTFDLNGDVIGIHSHIADSLHLNSDAHIASFHRAWDAMRQGTHHATHYSNSLDEKEMRETQSRAEANQQQQSELPTDNRGDTSQPSELRSLAERSKANGGSLKLSREALLQLRQNLAARMERAAPASGTRWIDTWARQWLAQFQPKTERFRKSVYRVIVSGRPVALGTAVHPDGMLVTKASEIKGKNAFVELGPQDLRPMEIVSISQTLDLALVKVAGVTLEPVDLRCASARSNTPSEMGTLCSAVGATDQSVGFGVVSVAQRSLDGKSGAYLGVVVAPDGQGLKIVDIKPNSPAVRAGLKGTDRIASVDGRAIKSNDELSDCIAAHVPGDLLRMDVERDQAQLTLMITLGDGAALAPMPGAREQAIDSESTSMSKRRWFFSNGLQHDCAIAARDCGGPLIDLEGRLLGINIARAGRIQSYAIPISDVAMFVRSNGFAIGTGDLP